MESRHSAHRSGFARVAFRVSLLKPKTVIGVFLLLLPYAVSFGSAGPTFILNNQTPYYLHAILNDERIAYIPPGTTLTRTPSGYLTVSAEVIISPGQGKTGSVSRVFNTVVHTTETGSHSASTDCSSHDENNTCSSSTGTNDVSSSSTTIDPIVWTVTADTLGVH